MVAHQSSEAYLEGHPKLHAHPSGGISELPYYYLLSTLLYHIQFVIAFVVDPLDPF